MTLLHPTRDELQIANVLHALSDPQRLRIVQLLAERSEPCACGSFGLDVTKSFINDPTGRPQHLSDYEPLRELV